MADIIDFERRQRDEQPKGWIDYPTSRRIHSILDLCNDPFEPKLAIIVTSPGMGKTYVIRRTVGVEMSGTVVTLDPTCRAVGQGLAAVIDALAADEFYRRHLESSRQPYFNSYGTGPMRLIKKTLAAIREAEDGNSFTLVIDEAQHARAALLEAYRTLYDAGLCSLVICANDAFSDRGLDALKSRAAFIMYETEPSDDDVAAFCNHYGIKSANCRALVRQAASEGGMRKAENLFRLATYSDPGAIPSYSDLEAALAMLRLPLSSSTNWKRRER